MYQGFRGIFGFLRGIRGFLKVLKVRKVLCGCRKFSVVFQEGFRALMGDRILLNFLEILRGFRKCLVVSANFNEVSGNF